MPRDAVGKLARSLSDNYFAFRRRFRVGCERKDLPCDETGGGDHSPSCAQFAERRRFGKNDAVAVEPGGGIRGSDQFPRCGLVGNPEAGIENEFSVGPAVKLWDVSVAEAENVIYPAVIV